MGNFDLSNLAIQALCPGNEILYDDKGMPSVMVKIPKMTYAQLGLGASTATFPAFIINGSEVPHIYISKYQNIIKNGRAYSLPGQDPANSLNFEAALAACTAKGSGWHLMTRFEWMAIAHWCKANQTLPYGNNDYGKDSRETIYKAIPTLFGGDGRPNRVATGTGPLTWSHDRTPSGIWDLNGNVSEWIGGMRTVYGELQILVNNNAADSNRSQSAASSEWVAINGITGEPITPDGNGTTPNSLKLDYVSNAWKWITGVLSSKVDGERGSSFENVTADETVGENAITLLKSLALLKHDNTPGAYESDVVYANNGAAERLFGCGGYWHFGAYAGVFCAYGSFSRAYANTFLGFRSAYVNLPSA